MTQPPITVEAPPQVQAAPTTSQRTMPRVCLLMGSFYPIVGGAETQARLLAERLIARGTAVRVITRHRPRDVPAREQVGSIPVERVPPGGFDRFGKYLMVPFALARLIRRRHTLDIIYVSGTRTLATSVVLLNKLLRKKVILRAASCGEISGSHVFEHSVARRSLVARAIRLHLALRRRTLRHADAFISISRVIRDEYLASGMPPDRIAFIVNGTDTERYRPVSEQQKTVLREQMSLPRGRPIFAYSGKLNRGKGLQCLLRAWQSVVAQRPEAYLLLIGGGAHQFLNCERELRAFVEDHQLGDHVGFTGYVTDVHRYLQAVDYFVFPSESEALSNALIEALACGLPAVATATGGILDVVQDGQNGLLVPVNDDQTLSQRILWLLDHPAEAERLGRAGRATIEQRFSIDAVADAHLRLFDLLCRPDSGVPASASIHEPEAQPS